MSLQEPLEYSDNLGLMTVSSEDQRVVELQIYNILKYYKADLTGADDLKDRQKIQLTKELHCLFAGWFIKNELPANFVALDASRTWQMYWCSHAFFGLLGQPCPPQMKQSFIDTISRCRPLNGLNKYGKAGFGGGPGQIMHLAPTYAAVMTLANVLDTREEWEALIDRQSFKDWLLSLKQPDGSFVMHENGEVDVRASYCALTCAALLNILTPDLTHNTAQFIANCQTYEGGFSGASFTQTSTSESEGFQGAPMAEAHGGYSFCALATYFLLCPPSASSRQPNAPERAQIDVDALSRWAAHMQGLPIEAGGFRGRTNKLVDGCYSWWNGGLFQFIEPYIRSADVIASSQALYNREALQEYILLVGQAKAGGLQDKPGKGNDTYHTCYCLSGLSAAQNKVTYDSRKAESSFGSNKTKRPTLALVKGSAESNAEAIERNHRLCSQLQSWLCAPENRIVVGLEENLVNPVHPIFGLEMNRAKRTLDIFYDCV